MYLRHLQLVDWRSYHEADLSLAPGVTTFVGSNGQGKTNLVEAVGFLATQASHRVANDAPLVRSGAARAVLRTVVARAGRDTTIELEVTPGKAKRARINRSPVPRAREALGILRTVFFAPEDLALVKGDPDGRRRFLDDLLVVRAPRFAAVRADYDRVVKQRNTLLRNAAGRLDEGASLTLEVWDQHLAGLGAELLSARIFLLGRLAAPVVTAYQQVSGTQRQVQLGYRCSVHEELSQRFSDQVTAAADGTYLDAPNREDLAGAILAQLETVRRRELDRGLTLVGPHRDDVELLLGGLPTRGYASHGESWSYALALRLASYELLRSDSSTADGEPVLILDDVFAELDADRRRRLGTLVSGAEQVLLTAAVDADVPAELAGVRVRVEEGTMVHE